MRIIVAGASGYLGQFLVKSISEAGHDVVAVVRSKKKVEHLKVYLQETIQTDISEPESIKGLFADADAVISTVGITRQKDGLTYMDVDYQCNINLLNEAINSNVSKFMYIGALNGDKYLNLKIMQAKERFINELLQASIEAYVIRPSGFFSDVTEMYNMAKRGTAYVFGKGDFKANPIHGEDLAEFCIEMLEKVPGVYSVGGPDVLTQKEIAEMAFHSLHKKVIIRHIPVWLTKIVKKLLVLFTKQTYYGPIEFFITVLTVDMEGPTYGKRHLKDYFNALKSKT